MAADKDFIVAIELGSSRISGIAGRKKDSTMQVLAYAEERTTSCVKRGVVWNIEKTYQSIDSIISKLETSLKAKISRAYVGVAGQSLRSYKMEIKRNMVTHSYITQEAVAAMREESFSVPCQDCQVLENIPQEYIVDSNVVADPVGVMGTNIEGDYIDIIANAKILKNINTVFENSRIKIADVKVAPCELANHILTEVEKRSGCAVVDLGADTTTVVVYRNNVIRFVVTIPLGMNNINKDFSSINIFESEAEELKRTYADALPFSNDDDDDENAGTPSNDIQEYISSDGRHIEMNTINLIIEARINEIIANVVNQLNISGYSDKLLAGIVLTGGGCCIKNICRAFKEQVKLDKIRIASGVDVQVVKASGISQPTFETNEGLTILSLLLSGKESCKLEHPTAENAAADGKSPKPTSPDLIDQMQAEEERLRRIHEKEEKDAEDAKVAREFDQMKAAVSLQIQNVKSAIADVEAHGGDKKLREKAEKLSDSVVSSVITESYQKNIDLLSSKEKYKQSADDGARLANELRDCNRELIDKIAKAKNDNKLMSKLKRIINDFIDEE